MGRLTEMGHALSWGAGGMGVNRAPKNFFWGGGGFGKRAQLTGTINPLL